MQRKPTKEILYQLVAESREEGDKLLKGLSAGGKEEMPIVGCNAGSSRFETRYASKSTVVKC